MFLSCYNLYLRVIIAHNCAQRYKIIHNHQFILNKYFTHARNLVCFKLSTNQKRCISTSSPRLITHKKRCRNIMFPDIATSNDSLYQYQNGTSFMGVGGPKGESLSVAGGSGGSGASGSLLEGEGAFDEDVPEPDVLRAESMDFVSPGMGI